ncbi:hypothetical protein LguiA_029707 [Lonicera macranthoides]
MVATGVRLSGSAAARSEERGEDWGGERERRDSPHSGVGLRELTPLNLKHRIKKDDDIHGGLEQKRESSTLKSKRHESSIRTKEGLIPRRFAVESSRRSTNMKSPISSSRTLTMVEARMEKEMMMRIMLTYAMRQHKEAKAGDNEDRISNFPNVTTHVLLTRILSFLSTKEAIRTSTLLTRWKSSRASLPTPDLSEEDFGLDEVGDSIGNFIEDMNISRKDMFHDFVESALVGRKRPYLENVAVCGPDFNPSVVESWISTAQSEIFACLVVLDSCRLLTFHNLTSLEFYDYIDEYWDWKLIMAFLKNSPILEVLIFKGFSFSHQARGNWVLDVPSCLVSHLKTKKIRGFLGRYEAMKVSYFLKNAKVLEKMTIETTAAKELLDLPRSSTTCKVEIH